MIFYVYILRSAVHDRWYVGFTSDVQARLVRHNNGSSKSIKPYAPWKVVYTEEFQTRSQAFRREQYFKSPSGYQEYRRIKEKINSGEFA